MKAQVHVFLMRRVFPLLFALVAGCGATRAEVLTRARMGIDAVRAAAVLEDEQLQLATVDASKTRAELDAALAAHRKARDLATKAYQAALVALAAAALDPSDLNIARLLELAAAYQKALAAMGVHL